MAPKYTLLNPYGETFPRPQPFLEELGRELRELMGYGVLFFLKAAELYDEEKVGKEGRGK